jgi:hypothetical protein
MVLCLLVPFHGNPSNEHRCDNENVLNGEQVLMHTA